MNTIVICLLFVCVLEVICSTMYYSPRYDMITNCLIHLGDDSVSGLFDDASDF